MALELLSQLCTFENSTNCSQNNSILILFRIAKRSIVDYLDVDTLTHIDAHQVDCANRVVN